MNNEKDIVCDFELPDVVAGMASGAAMATVAPIMIHKLTYPQITEKVITEKLEKQIVEKAYSISKPLFDRFTQLNPPPLEPIALKAWNEEAIEYVRNLPGMQELIKKETDTLSAKLLKSEHLNKASLWEKPLVAFNSLSTVGKIGVGALALASAVGVGYAVNRWRSDRKTYVEQINQERLEANNMSKIAL